MTMSLGGIATVPPSCSYSSSICEGELLRAVFRQQRRVTRTATTTLMRLVNSRTTDSIMPPVIQLVVIMPAEMQLVAEGLVKGVDSCTGSLPTHKQTNNCMHMQLYNSKSVLAMNVNECSSRNIAFDL